MSVTPDLAKSLAQGTTIDIFNETNLTTRRKLMEKYWSPSITVYEPGNRVGSGFDHVEESLAGFKGEGRGGWKCSFLGSLWVNGNLVSGESSASATWLMLR
jgi:hypothetical protein